MKSKLSIWIPLLFIILPKLNGQNGQIPAESNMSLWSVSISYSPKLDISELSYMRTSEPYFLSFDQRINYRFRPHLSLSIGLDLNYRNENQNPSDIAKLLLFEFPVQLNFHIRTPEKIFDPYLKLNLRNAYLYKYHEQTETPPYSTSQYFIFSELGIGSSLKLNSRVFLIYEASFGIGLKYQRSDYKYIEGLIGFGYKF